MRWMTANTAEMKGYRQRMAAQLALDDRHPPRPQDFAVHPEWPRLSGRVAQWIYDRLTLRPDANPLSREDARRTGEKALDEFRRRALESTLGLSASRTPDEGFHTNTIKPQPKVYNNFLFHYGLSTADHDALFSTPPIRAYISISRQHAEHIGGYFVGIVSRLKKAGVRFEAKALTPDQVHERLDHMLFYIHPDDQPKARDVLVKYLEEKKIGSKARIPAIAGTADGLSWALEPDAEETAIGRDISGSSSGFSHSELAALVLSGEYMKRLAEVHKKRGNDRAAFQFEQEAKRVETILEK